MRSPKFTRDELILLLDFYFSNYNPEGYPPSGIPDRQSKEIRELSQTLRKLARLLGMNISNKYRNLNGMHLTLRKFNSINPDHDLTDISRSSKLAEEMFFEFQNDLEYLHEIANAIKNRLEKSIAHKPESINEEDYEAPEGKLLLREHIDRERDKKIVLKKKTAVLEKMGSLVCEVCEFDFKKKYGEVGDGYIECHHKKKISEMKRGDKTKLEDLALVCANCHRIIHRQKQMLSIEELKLLIKQAPT